MHHKNHQTLQLVRSPALSNVVPISQVGTRIKLEVLIIIPARLSNRCEFILVRSVFILQDTGSTQEDIAQRTRERHERARKSSGA